MSRATCESQHQGSSFRGLVLDCGTFAFSRWRRVGSGSVLINTSFRQLSGPALGPRCPAFTNRCFTLSNCATDPDPHILRHSSAGMSSPQLPTDVCLPSAVLLVRRMDSPCRLECQRTSIHASVQKAPGLLGRRPAFVHVFFSAARFQPSRPAPRAPRLAQRPPPHPASTQTSSPCTQGCTCKVWCSADPDVHIQTRSVLDPSSLLRLIEFCKTIDFAVFESRSATGARLVRQCMIEFCVVCFVRLCHTYTIRQI